MMESIQQHSALCTGASPMGWFPDLIPIIPNMAQKEGFGGKKKIHANEHSLNLIVSRAAHSIAGWICVSLPGQGNSTVPSWVHCAVNALRTSAGPGAASIPELSTGLWVSGRRSCDLQRQRCHQGAAATDLPSTGNNFSSTGAETEPAE